ncbi:MAG: hypothetical protein KDK99_12375 [Verrucomicrobiales bacterium]|nr:hypothetical protein [Verrucomicrobiales bacterium]
MKRDWIWMTAAVLLAAPALQAQRAPSVGYVFPAGIQRGTDTEVVFGGQGLADPVGVICNAPGVKFEILGHSKPLSNQAASEVRDRLKPLAPKLDQMRAAHDATRAQLLTTARFLLREEGILLDELRQVHELERQRNDPKRQLNSQIAETVRVKVTASAEAEEGVFLLRLHTEHGLSNPLRFVVGRHVEDSEPPPPDEFDLLRFLKMHPADDDGGKLQAVVPELPATVNGQVLPGEVDEWHFEAKEGDQLVVSAAARGLIPYLADAVPGWFQAVVSLHNEAGEELAFVDDYRFDPDPVLFYKIPATGRYQLRIRDSIYRGREDFVYRLTVGQLPFLTGIQPLGGQGGTEVDVSFMGGNLEDQRKKRMPLPEVSEAEMVELHVETTAGRSNSVPLHVSPLPDEAEREGNNEMGSANRYNPPVMVNGSIHEPGDIDFYRVKGRGNQPLLVEVFARRLGSAVDSSITVFDVYGNTIGFNDDHEDPSAGLTTHHADSQVAVKLPSNGDCFVLVADTQVQGGPANVYRLSITQDEPRFALRVTPASVTARAGSSAKVTVHALRAGDFAGEIKLKLEGAPKGFSLGQATIPAGEEKAEVSLTVPGAAIAQPVALTVVGTGDGIKDPVTAVPAEDMMQAFIYRHLVPVDALMVDVLPVKDVDESE